MKNNNKLGQEPAFPCLEYNEGGSGNAIVLNIAGEKQIIPFKEGMSKRFYAACAAMQGMLANAPLCSKYENTDKLTTIAYDIADELLNQENQ